MGDRDVTKQSEATGTAEEAQPGSSALHVESEYARLPGMRVTSDEIPEDLYALAQRARDKLRAPEVREYVEGLFEEWLGVVDRIHDLGEAARVGPEGENLYVDPIAMVAGPFEADELAAIMGVLYDHAFPRSPEPFLPVSKTTEPDQDSEERRKGRGETKEELRPLWSAIAKEILWRSMRKHQDYRPELRDFIIQLPGSEDSAEGQARPTAGPRKGSGNREGRPRISLDRLRECYATMIDWQRAKSAGVSRTKFCDDKGIDIQELHRSAAIVARRGKLYDQWQEVEVDGVSMEKFLSPDDQRCSQEELELICEQEKELRAAKAGG
jgi:hypothetical protein